MSGRCCDIANGSWMGATEGPAVDLGLGLGYGLAAAVEDSLGTSAVH